MTVPADHLELFHRVLTNARPALVTPFKPARRIGRGPGGFAERRPGDRGPFAQTPANDRPSGPPVPEEPGSGFRPGPPPGETFPGRSGQPTGGMNRGDLQVMQVLAPVRNAAGDVAGVLAVVIRPEAALLRVRDRRAVEPAQVTARFIGDAAGSFSTDLSAVAPMGTRLQLGVGVLLSKTGSLTVRYQRDERKLYQSDRADLMLRWDY